MRPYPGLLHHITRSISTIEVSLKSNNTNQVNETAVRELQVAVAKEVQAKQFAAPPIP